MSWNLSVQTWTFVSFSLIPNWQLLWVNNLSKVWHTSPWSYTQTCSSIFWKSKGDLTGAGVAMGPFAAPHQLWWAWRSMTACENCSNTSPYADVLIVAAASLLWISWEFVLRPTLTHTHTGNRIWRNVVASSLMIKTHHSPSLAIMAPTHTSFNPI